MPIDKQKSSAYLRYRKEQSNKSYAKITELSGVPSSTLSAYFNGTVQQPNADIFQAIISCIGGSWEEYESWQPSSTPIKHMEDTPDMQHMNEIIAHIRQTYEDAAARTEAAYHAAISSSVKVARIQRIEKYVLFVLLIVVSVYAVFAFTHYDLQDPSSGLTSLLP